MRALIVTDVQVDFLPGGALQVPGSDVIVPIINTILPYFPLVVAAQDWHPQDHASFASNHPGRQPFEEIELDGATQVLWPDHCVQGSPGAQFPAALDTRRFEAIFRKGTDPSIDSYSSFFDNAHRKSTGLADYLRGKGVTDLFLCGLAGDICVYFSALDALALGFRVSFIRDAATPLDVAAHPARLETLAARGARHVDSGSMREQGVAPC
ncbi:MAG: bifunctional nicotinamidase/pyrazinamidase [Steroidobacteraceae bacterium]